MAEEIAVTERPGTVRGTCDPRFAAVREAFERNFAERGELGAAVSVWLDGEPVVDLWGGVADQATGRPWEADSLVTIFSATKGMTAACLHLLIDRGLIDVDAPVARYWPEFAANGKGDITVGVLMSHQAGLPFWQTEVKPGGMLDWDYAVALLAADAPVWEPGTSHGYHGRTIGYLLGELLRRVTGRTVGAFLRDEIAAPLGADVWLGLPESEEPRVSPVVMMEAFDPNSAMFAKLTDEPDWFGWKLLRNTGGADPTARAYRAAENPSGGGLASARGLARLYAPLSLDGALDGVRIVSSDALPRMRTVRSASDCDVLLRLPTTFTLGFSKTWGARAAGPGNHVILGEQAFGTPGMGGSVGFADGQARMAFAYVMNRHGGGVGLNDRGQSLVDAAYLSAGFRTSDPGVWVR